jgi:hypothetical protein
VPSRSAVPAVRRTVAPVAAGELRGISKRYSQKGRRVMVRVVEVVVGCFSWGVDC